MKYLYKNFDHQKYQSLMLPNAFFAPSPCIILHQRRGMMVLKVSSCPVSAGQLKAQGSIGMSACIQAWPSNCSSSHLILLSASMFYATELRARLASFTSVASEMRTYMVLNAQVNGKCCSASFSFQSLYLISYNKEDHICTTSFTTYACSETSLEQHHACCVHH